MWENFLSQLVHTKDQLLSEPSLWRCLTLLVYALGMWVYKKSGYKTIFTPLLVAIVILATILLLTGTSYKTFMQGGQHINFLLGPATVALAVPLYEQRLRLAKLWFPLACGLVAGGTVAIASAVIIAGVLGASPKTMISIAPKSVTVPIAMGVSHTLGGIPELTAALVVITGVVGALMSPTVLMLLREKNDAIRGFSIGLTAHGVGTATAFQMNRDTGAFSGLSMGLTGLYTAFAAPAIVPWIVGLFH